MATPEGDILKAVGHYLTLKKHFWWRNNSGAFKSDHGFYRFGTPGLPDIVVIRDGFFIGLECKTKAGRQSPDQKEFERRTKEAGAEYYVVRSVDDVVEVGL